MILICSQLTWPATLNQDSNDSFGWCRLDSLVEIVNDFKKMNQRMLSELTILNDRSCFFNVNIVLVLPDIYFVLELRFVL